MNMISFCNVDRVLFFVEVRLILTRCNLLGLKKPKTKTQLVKRAIDGSIWQSLRIIIP